MVYKQEQEHEPMNTQSFDKITHTRIHDSLLGVVSHITSVHINFFFPFL
jgi:hypothetical protein